MGASVATVLSLIFALVFILLFSPEIVKGLFNEGHFWLKLGLAITVMLFSVRIFTMSYMHFIGNERSDTLVMSLGGAFLGTLVFLGCALAFKLFSVREWLMLPGGKKILKVWQKIIRKEGIL